MASAETLQCHKRILRRKSAAEYLGLHPRTLDKLSREGRLPSVRFGAHAVAYFVEDLDAFARSCRVAG